MTLNRWRSPSRWPKRNQFANRLGKCNLPPQIVWLGAIYFCDISFLVLSQFKLNLAITTPESHLVSPAPFISACARTNLVWCGKMINRLYSETDSVNCTPHDGTKDLAALKRKQTVLDFVRDVISDTVILHGHSRILLQGCFNRHTVG